MSGVMSGPSLDASGVLTWKLLTFLAGQRPSAQEGRGDGRLDYARELARENEAVISPSDMEIVRERILLATEIKMGLDTKSGLPKYLQAREYRKSAKETLKFVKTVSDRARDTTLGKSAAAGVRRRDTTSGLRSGVRTPRPDAVPLQVTMQFENPILINSEASMEVTSISKRLCADVKLHFATLVENMYNFQTSQAHTSISHNARRAQELLRDLNFIYPGTRTGRDQYRHPVIQRAIETTWFRNKDDVGVVEHEHFSPMPISVIAITLTMIECCIDEWSSGTRIDSNWDDAKFQTVYDSHVSSLNAFQAHSPTNRDVLHRLQCDLLRKAREHAGVPPDPVTGLSRFPPGALDAVREEDNQYSPTAPPDYDDTVPRITIDCV